MKILFTGGGTGGHFYPIIAIAEKINELAAREKIIETKLYFMSDAPYDRQALFENGVEFVSVSAGKLRRYFSLQNFFDVFKTGFGILRALFAMFSIYPDVVVSKGGYSSFPALVAARLLSIPVMIHESDSTPGRVNRWAAKFAARIAVSHQEAAQYFPTEKTAWTGQPIRGAIKTPAREGAFEYLKLDPTVPVVFIIGGSQGAEIINNLIIDTLPELVGGYQIIHQVGPKNIDDISIRSGVILHDNPYKERYQAFGYLNTLAIKMAAGAASIVVSRAGSTIFEIAAWGVPSIIIPITDSNGDHQRKNAFTYARAGAAVVIEEANLTPHVLLQAVENIIFDKAKWQEMSAKAIEFAHGDAAKAIAEQAIGIALSHEK